MLVNALDEYKIIGCADDLLEVFAKQRLTKRTKKEI
jgi:hypothetical protein